MQYPLDPEALRWPYPVDYDIINRIETDVLVIGGGVAGCGAALGAARRGMKVAICDKAPMQYSGNSGAGIDHWNDVSEHPKSSRTTEEKYASNRGDRMNISMFGRSGPTMTHRDYIATKGTWDALLELEKMGLPIRDVDGDFDGAPTKDDESGLLKAYNYDVVDSIKLRGGNFLKPVMYRTMKKEGVKTYNRVMMTALLTEGGKQGARIAGGMGFSVETGEFYVFRAKSVIISTGYVCGMWICSTELTGSSYRWDPNDVGEGAAMAYLAGAKLYGFYDNGKAGMSHPFAWPRFGVGSNGNTWTPCTIVDNCGKPVEPLNRKREGLGNRPDVMALVRSGEYELPFWADLSALPEREARSIWGMMVGNEGKTRYTLYDYYTRNGFNPEKHLLWCPIDPKAGIGNMHGDNGSVRQWRSERGGQGEIAVDWDLMTSVPGLYAAGASSGLEGASYAISSGFYAGNRAAEFAKAHELTAIDERQVMEERRRVYAPVERNDDPEACIEWKELWAGTARVMQQCCAEVLTRSVLEFGIDWLKSIEESEAKLTYARNPHELARVMECSTRITVSRLFLRACIARLEAEEKGFQNEEFLFNWLEGDTFRWEIVDKLFYLKAPNAPTYLENYNAHRAREKE